VRRVRRTLRPHATHVARQVAWYPGSTAAAQRWFHDADLLSRLQDTARIDAFLADLAAGGYGKGRTTSIVRAAGLCPERATV